MRKPTKVLIRPNLKVEYINNLGFRNQTFYRCVLPLVEICYNYVVLRSDILKITYRLRYHRA